MITPFNGIVTMEAAGTFLSAREKEGQVWHFFLKMQLLNRQAANSSMKRRVDVWLIFMR
ncbi:MAG: hypothetical protein K1X61_01430 [Chitinophagales bacterium]|nr:hypothetical protein [Chitinophagales bacterium]